MFSFLDMINHYLGYFNINVKLKSRIYTILGTLGDLYLFYIAIRFLSNRYFSRGLLILLIAAILLYFVVCNAFYYFTNKQPWFDISPRIAKALHLENHQQEVHTHSKLGQNVITNPNLAANGLFDSQHVLPAKVTIGKNHQQNIAILRNQLVQANLLQTNYSGYSDKEMAEMLRLNNGKPIYAIGAGVMVPYFEMKKEAGTYVVYGGINQAQILPLGEINRIGLQSINSFNDKNYRLYLATITVVGGPYKRLGRSMVTEHDQPYTIRVKVAYEKQRK